MNNITNIFKNIFKKTKTSDRLVLSITVLGFKEIKEGLLGVEEVSVGDTIVLESPNGVDIAFVIRK